MRALSAVLIALLVAGCAPKAAIAPVAAKPNAAGLLELPCDEASQIRPVSRRSYCSRGRNFMTPAATAALARVAARFSATEQGAPILYMEASWASGKRPMPPHLSHGDGREIDLALLYESRTGKPLMKPPRALEAPGYGAFEPPRRESERACRHGARGLQERPDPLPGRGWRLDEKRTATLVRLLAADPGVRRIFIEPHLKARLGFANNAKVRFAGCQAARHDDHIHVDFY